MKYLYLLYADESKMAAPGSPQFDAQNDAFNKYFEELDGKGMFKAGEGSWSRSTTVHKLLADYPPRQNPRPHRLPQAPLRGQPR